MRVVPPAERTLKNHVSLSQTLRNTLTMADRGLIKMRRTPEQLIDVTVQPIVFTVMFTYIFGGAIAGDVQSYLPFLIPGILVQTVITTSVVTGVQLREDMDKGVFDRFRSLPIARIAPLSGALLADTVRYAIATTITFAIGYLMGYRPAGGPWAGARCAGLLVIVCSWAISWIFAFFGVHRPHGVQRAGHLVPDPVPADVPLERLRAGRDAAPGAGVVRQHQPGLAPGDCGARAGQRRDVIGADVWMSLIGPRS